MPRITTTEGATIRSSVDIGTTVSDHELGSFLCLGHDQNDVFASNCPYRRNWACRR